jgi:hypothetical protein
MQQVSGNYYVAEDEADLVQSIKSASFFSTVIDQVIDGNNVVIEDNSFYGAFTAKYPGSLGNALEVAWVTATGFSSDLIDVGDIPTNKISNTSVNQTIEFNSNSLTFELGNTAPIASLPAIGDILVIGNSSVGYQELPPIFSGWIWGMAPSMRPT